METRKAETLTRISPLLPIITGPVVENGNRMAPSSVLPILLGRKECYATWCRASLRLHLVFAHAVSSVLQLGLLLNAGFRYVELF